MISPPTVQNAITQQMQMPMGISNGQQTKLFQPKSTPPTILPKSAQPNTKNSVAATKMAMPQQQQQLFTIVSQPNQFLSTEGHPGAYVQIAESMPPNNITVRDQQSNFIAQNSGRTNNL